ncbi:MAG TPA: ABC transporter substrate-binding protein [Thermomicrobiales bacterium]|jgi:putative hydroxymethylpyrimidine transport system substrate-binding protein
MNRRQFLRGAGLMLGVGITMAACGGKASTLPQGASGLTKVSLVLDWYPWANHTGLYLAQSRGYFKDQGLEVDIHAPSNPEDILKVVAAGTDNFGISYQTDVLSARAAGVPVKSVAAIVQHPLNTVMALKGAGITRPKDLEGKKVGIPGVPSDGPLLKTMVEADGGNIAKVEQINVGFDLIPSLIGKKVDAVIGAYEVHEAAVAELQGFPVQALRVQDWGVPDYYELVLVTSDNMIKQNADVVRKFMIAVSKGYADAQNDQAAAIDALIAGYPDADRKVEVPGLAKLAPLWTDGVSRFGEQTTARWQQYADWLRAEKILDKEVKVEDCFTTEFLPK